MKRSEMTKSKRTGQYKLTELTHPYGPRSVPKDLKSEPAGPRSEPKGHGSYQRILKLYVRVQGVYTMFVHPRLFTLKKNTYSQMLFDSLTYCYSMGYCVQAVYLSICSGTAVQPRCYYLCCPVHAVLSRSIICTGL